MAESIFCRVEQSSSTVFEIRLSVMEIYQEKLRDLLSEPSLAQSKALRIREQSDGAVWVEGLTEIVLHGEEDFTDRMGQSLKRRTVADNNVNQQSSRSHMCCIITVRQSTEGLRRVSKIHLIDLAGSEMVNYLTCLDRHHFSMDVIVWNLMSFFLLHSTGSQNGCHGGQNAGSEIH